MRSEELRELFTERFGERVVDVTDQARTFTVTLDHEGYVAAAQLCRDDPRLSTDMFDCSFGVDEREDGFSVTSVLYSTTKRHRILLRTMCSGGRETPRAPSLTHLFRGADWMERETYDMFGIEFDGHPGVLPRILCVENFEGWPLRKDFYLASREAKPWPGVKEPAELDEDGNVIVRPVMPGDAPGPALLDEVMAKQAREANPQPDPEPELVEPGEDAAPELPDPGPTATVSTTDAGAVVVADDAEHPAPDAGTDGEQDDPAAAAQQTADDRRRAQAEARARKAAERIAAARAEEPDGDDAGADGEDGA